MKNLRWILPCAVVAAAACFYFTRDPWLLQQKRLASKLSGEILTAQEVEIYLLDPVRGGGPKGAAGVLPTNELFGRRKVLGSALLEEGVERKRLCDSIEDGLRHAKMLGPECWEPRHALRFRTKAGDNFLVVSFACTHGFFDEPGSSSDWFDIPRQSEGVWDGILSAHHVSVSN
jgi:hypothetical protein